MFLKPDFCAGREQAQARWFAASGRAGEYRYARLETAVVSVQARFRRMTS